MTRISALCLLSTALSFSSAHYFDPKHEKPGFLSTTPDDIPYPHFNPKHVRSCVVTPAPNGTDSAPAIIEAFASCGHEKWPSRGSVIFKNETYTIATVMNTTGLSNVDIDHKGTLLWNNSNLTYWLNNSIPVGYQNQTSA
jgi:hypothetical protein